MGERPAENPVERQESKKTPEEYLLYVRVPNKDGHSLKAINGFLEHIADMLSHDDVYVEDYMEYDGTDKKKKGAGGGAGAGAAEAAVEGAAAGAGGTDDDPAGNRRSALYPMYLCHNKF
jgi:hypothetical protein